MITITTFLKNLLHLLQVIDIFTEEPEVDDFTMRPTLEDTTGGDTYNVSEDEDSISPSSAEINMTFTCISSSAPEAPDITFTVASETSEQESTFMYEYEATERTISSSSVSPTSFRPLLNVTITYTDAAPTMTSTPALASPTSSRPINETFTFTSTSPVVPNVTFTFTPAVASPTASTPVDPEVRMFEDQFCCSWRNETFNLPAASLFIDEISLNSVRISESDNDLENYSYEDDVFAEDPGSPVPEWRFLGTGGSVSLWPRSCRLDQRPRRSFTDKRMAKWRGRFFKQSSRWTGDQTF